MLIFAITTTTKLAGLSLYENDKLLGEMHVEMAKTHSTTILEQIDSLLKWTGKKLDEIESVLVSIGPGSFTGVRIAISVVKGMFFGRNVNFYEVNEPKGEFVLVLEGRNGEEIKKEKEESFKSLDLNEHMKIYLDKGMDKREAMRAVAKDRGVAKREVYNGLLKTE